MTFLYPGYVFEMKCFQLHAYNCALVAVDEVDNGIKETEQIESVRQRTFPIRKFQVQIPGAVMDVHRGQALLGSSKRIISSKSTLSSLSPGRFRPALAWPVLRIRSFTLKLSRCMTVRRFCICLPRTNSDSPGNSL